jgi:hypothetical protein
MDKFRKLHCLSLAHMLHFKMCIRRSLIWFRSFSVYYRVVKQNCNMERLIIVPFVNGSHYTDLYFRSIRMDVVHSLYCISYMGIRRFEIWPSPRRQAVDCYYSDLWPFPLICSVLILIFKPCRVWSWELILRHKRVISLPSRITGKCKVLNKQSDILSHKAQNSLTVIDHQSCY